MPYIFATYYEVLDQQGATARVAGQPQRARTEWEGPGTIYVNGIGTFHFHGVFWMADGSLQQAGREGPREAWQGFIFEETDPQRTTSRPNHRIALKHSGWSRLAAKVQYTQSIPLVRPRLVTPYHRLAATHGFLIDLFERTEIEERGSLARRSIAIEGLTFRLWELLGLDVETGAPLQDGYLAPNELPGTP